MNYRVRVLKGLVVFECQAVEKGIEDLFRCGACNRGLFSVAAVKCPVCEAKVSIESHSPQLRRELDRIRAAHGILSPELQRRIDALGASRAEWEDILRRVRST